MTDDVFTRMSKDILPPKARADYFAWRLERSKAQINEATRQRLAKAKQWEAARQAELKAETNKRGKQPKARGQQ
jgi:hypothetical protein